MHIYHIAQRTPQFVYATAFTFPLLLIAIIRIFFTFFRYVFAHFHALLQRIC